MSKVNDGGPAFPQSNQDLALHPVTDIYDRDLSSGMSLRDWFAGQAIAAFIQIAKEMAMCGAIETDDVAPWAANSSYEVADAFLQPREATHG